MKDWNSDIPEEERRQLEKKMRFAALYGTRGRTLKQLADMRFPGWWTRLWQKLFGVRCLTCRVKLNEKYWSSRYPDRKMKFDSLIRMICMSRQRCAECALAEERVASESRKSP